MKHIVNGRITSTRIAKIQRDYFANSISGTGAVSTFLGIVRRDKIKKKQTKAIEYQVYDSMAEKAIDLLVSKGKRKFKVQDILVLHSRGVVKSGEISLYVFVSSAHRAECISALKDVVEAIKFDVPIWKKEIFEDGTFRWL